MTSTLVGFFVFWGVWLFVPLLIDGTTAALYFIGAWRYERGPRRKREQFELTKHPTVAIIVPVRNGEEYLATCLDSIRNQTYPQEKLHVIVVDNMSADRTREVFQEQQARPFEGRMQLIELTFAGKAWALNAGIHMTGSDYVCNVDSDSTLKRDAIY
ncbi:MAG: glycosyltransferase, partial [Ardenticatenaceae bacterium]